ncbi:MULTISPECIES: AcrB/AcrD/AcrF family protein [unclassified Sphingomonas]|uniref:AcrB/AcrD/AcrF family protein n=1 Tax=unclassified Sphingomonas TaxID=196159 RepID=UPI00226A6E9A|nr:MULTISPECIES: AcrB/AcrD/AcrF family protein [unclassified Sphingomonas]
MNNYSRGTWTRDLERHWIALTLLAWLGVTIWYVWSDWNMVRWLSLGDTDDNMRLMQVRAWLGGQGWYDLRQYRLNPPVGANIHWSRIVDLPIAGMILFFRLFTSNAWAERLACGIAPLLPLSITMLGVSATVRRLIHPLAWPLALIFLLGTAATMLMFLPERIDHHGWQLAMLSLTVAGLCDGRGARGGIMVGLASAVSLSIGLEMLPYAAMAGAILALRWVWDRAEAPRLSAYALSLGGGGALGFAAFASNANYEMRCDALTPVWLSVMVAAGALLFVLAWINPAARAVRFGLAAVAGVVIAAGFAHFFPQCLGRPEGVSPELQKNWLDNVREAKPIYKHPFRLAFPIAALPIVGLLGVVVGTWRARRGAALIGWTAVALFVAFATAMLLWQIRAGPAAQLLAVPGATLLGWIILPWFANHRLMAVRIGGTVVGFLLVSGLFAGLIIKYLPVDRPNAYTKRVNRASGNCVRYTVLKALDRYPAQTIFTFVDLSPRLITVTHHDAIAGPYHRNGDAILDVQHAFQGSADQAHGIIRRHGATMLLLCPNMSESTNYRARAPGGFYDQLAHGKVPAWLTPLPLPAESPLRLFKVD